MINLADVSLSKLHGYRDFVSPMSKYRLSRHAYNQYFQAFQPALTDHSHRLFLSLESLETWTTHAGYETWLKNSKDLSKENAHAQALVDDTTARDIKQFRDVVSF